MRREVWKCKEKKKMDDSYDCGLRENPHLHRSKKKKKKLA